MIQFLIGLLLLLQSGGNPCTLGTPVDIHQWAEHRETRLVFTINATGTTPDLWLYRGGDEYVLFVFDEPIEDVLARGESAAHGECAVRVEIGR